MKDNSLGLAYCHGDAEVVVLEVSRGSMKNFNYLVIDPVSRNTLVVDPAWQMDKIEDALAFHRGKLQGILLTHSHPDHVNLAKPMAQKYQCPIFMSAREISASGFEAEQLVAIDETPWSVGDLLVQPILTPGHTAGCMCYLIGDNLFTGDVLFAEGCGICPSTEAAHEMYFSLERLKAELAPQTYVYPGHCYGKLPGQVFASLLKENLYLQFPNKEMFASFRMRKGQNKKKMFSFS